MATRVDPTLMGELKAYGTVGIEKCFNCGNCTAICPLTSDAHPFPRNIIRLTQIGLKDRLLASSDPWLCYYCGDCSATCPRGAEPGETMMALRRWLTARYDWTGLARKLYTSKTWSGGAVFLAFVLVLLLAAFFHGPTITERVELNTFAPVEVIHLADMILGVILAFFLLTNLFRMHYLIIRKDPVGKMPLSLYLSQAWILAYHFFTQEGFSKCEGRRRWVSHLILVSGYVTMFALIVIFLPWFQTDNIYPIYHPQRWVGYLAAFALIYGAGEALWGRIQKRQQMHRFSHISDWLFPVQLVLLAVSGLMIHVFRYQGLALATYYTYVFHLAIMLTLYVCVGPMGKWSHLAYRPFAIYLQAVKEKALEQQTAREAPAPIGSD
jgi:quinone-modifying oxidoreductase subunit QmoC